MNRKTLHRCETCVLLEPQKRDEIPVHSKYFQQFAEWLERDPDPHFTGIVNWYFTGSTMKTVTFEDRVMLCHTFGPELNQLGIFGTHGPCVRRPIQLNNFLYLYSCV